MQLGHTYGCYNKVSTIASNSTKLYVSNALPNVRLHMTTHALKKAFHAIHSMQNLLRNIIEGCHFFGMLYIQWVAAVTQ